MLRAIRPPRLLAALALAAAAPPGLARCTRPATQLVAVVNSDFVESDPLAAIAVAVEDPDAGVERQPARFELVAPRAPAPDAGSGRYALPLSLGIVPDNGDARRRVRVIARGYGTDGRLRVSRSALTGFVAHASLLLPLFLPRACADVVCPRAQTCVEGPPVGCVSDAIDPTRLPRAGVDGGEFVDAGPLPFDGTPVAPLDASDGGGGGGDADAGPPVDAGPDATPDPSLGAPRPIAPLSGSVLSNSTPTLRWELPSGADAVRIEVCPDRACTTVTLQLDVGPMTSTALAVAAGQTVFWRMTARRGATPGLMRSPVWQLRTSMRASGAALTTGQVLDVNGDGAADLAAGTPVTPLMGLPMSGRVRVYLGGGAATAPLMTPASMIDATAGGEEFGRAVANAGDVNGDGFTDLAVGAPSARPRGLIGAGVVRVYAGSRTGLVTATPLAVLEGETENEAFGRAVAGVGDTNGDGYADLAVGAPSASTGGRMSNGRVRIFFGGPAGPSARSAVQIDGTADRDLLGTTLAGPGDVNGDGYADVLIGAPSASRGPFTSNGLVQLHLGSAMAGPPSAPALTITGEHDRVEYGDALAGAGDTNGDGRADVLVGAPADLATASGVATGVVRLYPGSATGLNTTAVTRIDGDVANERFGDAVAGACDVDGDGDSDFVVGAPDAASVAGANTGRARVYVGDATGPTASTPLLGTISGETFGASAAGCGDYDADGYADVAIGAPLFDNGTSFNVGVLRVFRGGATGISAVAAQSLAGLTAGESLARALARLDRPLRCPRAPGARPRGTGQCDRAGARRPARASQR